MWIKTETKRYLNARHIRELKATYNGDNYTINAIYEDGYNIICHCDSREQSDEVIMLILQNIGDNGFIDAVEMVEVSRKLKRGECVRVQ